MVTEWVVYRGVALIVEFGVFDELCAAADRSLGFHQLLDVIISIPKEGFALAALLHFEHDTKCPGILDIVEIQPE